MKEKKNLYKFIIALLILAITFTLSITLGRYPISMEDFGKIILGGEVNPTTKLVFFQLRLPRTIMVVLGGLGLGMAGSIYQMIFKNPLATPDIMGVSSGANLGAAIAIIFFTGGSFVLGFSAFLGGLLGVITAIGLTNLSKDKGISSIVLAGIVITSIAQGIIMMLKYFADPERQLAAIEFWSMGSFAGITLDKLLSILPFFILGIIILFLLRWQINILSLTDDEGKSLGVNVTLIRTLAIIGATLVVASIVSVTGLISFIGLIGPHIGRIIRKKNDFNTGIFSGIIGAIILIIADSLARNISSSEIPISILTTFIGAPYLAYLIVTKDRRL
mgnify:CR=1 FL=1